MLITTDYLVVGAGASGLAFADTLLAETDAEVTVIDCREAPGGHWADAYSFLRLHTPSAFYGVNSLALGEDRIDETGENAGFYERASADDVVAYFAESARRLTQTGRARVLTRHEHLGAGSDGQQVRDLSTGELHDVAVRRKVVDARYLEGSVPATHVPPFDVASGVRFVPVNDLPAAARSDSSYTIIGSGKTAVDACVWLLEHDVEPDRIRWIRPRDAWFYDRRNFQPLAQVGAVMEGFSRDAEAAAEAASVDELFERLEAAGRFARIDPSQPATMFRGTMLSAGELEMARQIRDVVRLGRVRRIEADRIVLERGEIETGEGAVHVDCSALGLSNAPATPVFQRNEVVLQQVRLLSPCFNAALIAFVEAHRDDDAEKNELCPPHPYPSGVEDWPHMMSRGWRTEERWTSDPDLVTWAAQSRLNLVRALPEHAAEPAVQAAVTRYLTHLAAAVARMTELDDSTDER